MTAVRNAVRVQKRRGRLYAVRPHNRPSDVRAKPRGRIELKPLRALWF
jgi:hypothetical protein